MAIYTLLPRTSPLWKWPIATLCGAIAGASVIYFYGAARGGSLGYLSSYGAFAGGVTCLFAGVTARRYQDVRKA